MFSKNTQYIRILFILIYCLIATNSLAKPTFKEPKPTQSVPITESLSDFTKRDPYFLENKAHANHVASRCSALYYSLQIQLEAFSNDNDLKATWLDIKNKAYILDQSRRYLKNDQSHFDESSLPSQVGYLHFYASDIIKNWKKNNNIFQGVVNEDYNVCEDYFSYFKKFNINLSKEIKLNSSR